jgi:D-alanyl-D-alanine carboxypeptidase
MMNQKAKQLGAVHTHFVNPNGLQNPNHYSCAYDMALIGRAAMQNPILRKIVDTKYYAWHGAKWNSNLVNLNDLLWTYPGVNGVKTGWTDQAMQTIVFTAKKGNLSLLGVIMHVNGLDEVHQEATALLNYGFDHFHTGILLPKGTMITSLTLLGQNIPISINHNVIGAVPNEATSPLMHSPVIIKKSNLTFYNTTRDVDENIPRSFFAIDQPVLLPRSISLSLLPIVSQEKSGSLVGTANLSIDYSSIPFQVIMTKKTPTWSAPTLGFTHENLTFLALTCACVCSTSGFLVVRNVKARKKRTLYRQSSQRLGMSRR